VAVAPGQSARALILSVSPEAQEEGIFKGMPLGKAIKQCPGLKVLPPNPTGTEKANVALAKMVDQYTPLWEPSRPGHIHLDVTGTARLWGKAREAADRLRREIKARFQLSGMLGVASNKMISSIASRTMASEGVCNVPQGQEASFMAPLKVHMIPGIGYGRQKTLLETLNITRVRELATLDMASLRLLFGPQAALIHQRAHGIDPTPVYPAPVQPMVSEEVVLAQDENVDDILLKVLYRLVEQCARRLRARSLFPRKGGLLIRYADDREARRQTMLPCPSFWDCDLYPPLERLFFQACNRRVRVRFIRVWFWNFSPLGCQLSLFQDRSPVTEKKRRLIQTMDRIRARYGETSINYG